MPKQIDPYDEYFMSLQDIPKKLSTGKSPRNKLSAKLSAGAGSYRRRRAAMARSAKCSLRGVPVRRPSFHKTRNKKKRSQEDLSRTEASFRRRMDRYEVACGEKQKTSGGLTRRDLIVKRGRLVSKKASKRASQRPLPKDFETSAPKGATSLPLRCGRRRCHPMKEAIKARQ